MLGYKRIVRGIKALLGLARPDDAWAKAWLLPEEYALFAALDPRDREHSVMVAKELLRRFPEAPPAAVRAALLHDAGKAVRPYRPLERILTALFEPWLPKLPPEPLLPGFRGAIQVRQHHERYALAKLQDPGVRGILKAMAKEPDVPEEARRWGERIRAVDDAF